MTAVFIATGAMMAVVLVQTRAASDPKFINLKYSSMDQKLNFIVERINGNMDRNNDFLPGLVGIVVFFVILPTTWVVRKMLTSDVFYWGKETARVDRLVKLRYNVVWGVIVAGLIGVFSSIVAGKISI